MAITEGENNNSNELSIATLPANAVSYSDTGLSSRKSYSYRVQAYNGTGASAYSNVVTAKTK